MHRARAPISWISIQFQWHIEQVFTASMWTVFGSFGNATSSSFPFLAPSFSLVLPTTTSTTLLFLLRFRLGSSSFNIHSPYTCSLTGNHEDPCVTHTLPIAGQHSPTTMWAHPINVMTAQDAQPHWNPRQGPPASPNHHPSTHSKISLMRCSAKPPCSPPPAKFEVLDDFCAAFAMHTRAWRPLAWHSDEWVRSACRRGSRGRRINDLTPMANVPRRRMKGMITSFKLKTRISVANVHGGDGTAGHQTPSQTEVEEDMRQSVLQVGV